MICIFQMQVKTRNLLLAGRSRCSHERNPERGKSNRMSRDSNRTQEYQEEPSDDGYELHPRKRRRRYDEEEEFHPLRRRRARWPFLLMGCAGGIVIVIIAAAIGIFTLSNSLPTGGLGSVGSSQMYSSTNRQPLGPSSITQVQ